MELATPLLENDTGEFDGQSLKRGQTRSIEQAAEGQRTGPVCRLEYFTQEWVGSGHIPAGADCSGLFWKTIRHCKRL